jgi:ribonuclease Z
VNEHIYVYIAGHVFCSHGHIDHIGATVSHARARALTSGAAIYYMPENCIAPILAVKAAFEQLDEREIPMILKAIRPGDIVQITNHLKVKAFPTLHRVPSQGYAIYSTTKSNVLQEEYKEYDRVTIKSLIKDGIDIYKPAEDKLQICYTGDTVMEGLLQAENAYIFSAPLLIMELTYLDGDPAKAIQWGHVHLNDILSNASIFRNQQLLLVHMSQKYFPSRAIHILQTQLPPELCGISALSLRSFGVTEHVTPLNVQFEQQRQVGWGWARIRGTSEGRRATQQQQQQRRGRGGSKG